ncbi:hypothetical protein Pyrde_0978 [Pyrodictium delaneyi]|uniref:DUF424 domain-containing protein n=1 Tax=Pyrodictium delaneyi TaxID=1273541 RepID=A0A0P0N292_9CREN|nr:DUF424 family protein [Pyrodictium delaneyi]ALL01026.1 hypothetical protein Pyrde_0978 [Pyrodictium delaneyi]OWJ55766.1 hypothetical protein Pdsh_00760 [Pyrodictium delaneyi]
MESESEPLVYINIIEAQGEKIVAMCDRDLLGVKLVDGKLVLHVNERFYGGELVPLSYAMTKAREATVLNLVGENVVNAAIREGLVHPEAVIRVAGVPHAQAVKMPY